MPQKNATPTREQQDILTRNGLRPHVWVVIKELTNTLIIKHRITNEFRVIVK